MTLSEMRRWLDERGIQLTKSLGQNFLHDGNQLRRIAAAAELSQADKVLEIGPGLGPLTELLLEQAGEVLALEIDARLVKILDERFREKASRLTLVHADALKWIRQNPRDWSGWKLVANLPYSVGSPILVELAQTANPPERIVVTLQLEVVKRLLAKADTDDYGLLTLLVQLRYEPRGWFKVPAGCFFPPPNVDSGCITLVRRASPLLSVESAAVFTRLVKLAFGQRRKMMFKLLTAAWPAEQLEKGFAAAGIARTARGEQVSLEQFVTLTRELTQ
jgi:16S rRNA (adenine1518-N6/adenine1519-N6)-dimethyltransferase